MKTEQDEMKENLKAVQGQLEVVQDRIQRDITKREFKHIYGINK